MAAPPSYLSTLTGFTLIDTRNNSGVVNLPPASTLYGRIITFKDQYANFHQSTLTLSTIGVDLLETSLPNLTISTQSAYTTVIAGSDNKWYTIASYLPPGATPSSLSTTILVASTLQLPNLDQSQPPANLTFSTTSLLLNGQPFTTPLQAKYQVFTL
jgi:hypothetical protein